MEKRNVLISKKTRGIGFVLVNGKVVTVRSGKPVGAAILPDSITSRHKDLQFSGAKQAAAKVTQGVQAPQPVEKKEETNATPAPSPPPVEQGKKTKKASPPPMDFDQLGEIAVSKAKTKEETKAKYQKGKGKRSPEDRVTEDDGGASEPEL